MSIEIRCCGEKVVARGPGMTGYAARYNVRSMPIGGDFIEVIKPGAFERTLRESPDIRGLLQHDPSQLFGRTKSGTLQLRSDEQGLAFEVAELPKTGCGPVIAEGLARGDLDGMSFGFRVPEGGDVWSVEPGGAMVRTLLSPDLLEISLTAFPAYPDTSVALRSLKAWHDKEKRRGRSVQKSILEILTKFS